MIWPQVDYHSHICVASLDAMVASARAAGIVELGVSEHIFQLNEGHLVLPELAEEGERFDRAWYVDTLRDSAAASADVMLRLGLEVDFVPAKHDPILAVLAGIEWDYLIGSVHEVDGKDIFSYVPSGAAEGERLWLRYYELIAEAIESGAFDVISHPVRNAERNPYLPARLDGLLEEVAAFAKLHGVALELNGHDTTTWPELAERVARACGRAGCPVSLGSDAHHPQQVGVGLTQAAAFAARAGVPGVMSFTRRERRVLPLGR